MAGLASARGVRVFPRESQIFTCPVVAICASRPISKQKTALRLPIQLVSLFWAIEASTSLTFFSALSRFCGSEVEVVR